MILREIDHQIARIDNQIATEQKIHDTMKEYMNCDMKYKILEQTLGAIRGLEVGKEALTYIREQITNDEKQMSMDDMADQIDYRGGMITGDPLAWKNK